MIDCRLVRRLYRERLPLRYIARTAGIPIQEVEQICGCLLNRVEDLYDAWEDMQARPGEWR